MILNKLVLIIKKKIYRVSNDFAFATLNKAARYGFNTQNEVQGKDEKAFEKLVNMIQDQEIKNIKFNSFITNEEALILQNISDKFEINLINEEAKKFQDFINIFIKTQMQCIMQMQMILFKVIF